MVGGQPSSAIYIGELGSIPDFEKLFQDNFFVFIKVQEDGLQSLDHRLQRDSSGAIPKPPLYPDRMEYGGLARCQRPGHKVKADGCEKPLLILLQKAGSI